MQLAKREMKGYDLLMVAGLLVAFALRVYRLGDQNIWWDEGLAIWAVRHRFLETTLWTAGDVHPPLYFWLLWPWVRLVGESEFTARYLTVLVAVLTVAVMAPLGRRLGGRAVGGAALWLLALSRFHIWWSQEMRMYALAALAATGSFYFLARIVAGNRIGGNRKGGDRKGRPYGPWVAATVAALYTIYFSALLLVVQNLYVFLVGLRRTDRWVLWRRWLMAQGAALALWAPWLALALPRMRSWSVVQEPVSPAFVFLLDGVLLTLGISTYVERYLGAVLAAGFVLLWGTVALVVAARRSGSARRTAEGLWLLVVGTLIPPLMVWLVTQPRMLFYTPRVEARYFLPFAPLFFAWLAWALAALLARPRLRPVGAVAVAVVVVPMLWALPGHYADRRLRDDLQSMVRAIWVQARPEDAVVLVSGDRYPLFLYSYDRAPAPADRPPVYLVPRKYPLLDEAGAEAELAPIAEAHSRIWLAEVERHFQDPQGVADAWLSRRRTRLLALGFGHNRLHLFGPAGEDVMAEGAGPQYPLSAWPAPGLEVRGYDLAVREVRPGDPLRLGLHLRAEQPVTGTVALVGPEGEVARSELALMPTDRPLWQMVEFPVATCVPSGRYHFELRVPQGATVSFGAVRVTHTQPSPSPAEIPHPMATRLGESIRLAGYGLYREWGPGFWRPLSPGGGVRPGTRLRLDLYWQADGPVEENYVVFTHLVGAAHNPATGGPVWAQDDHKPLYGRDCYMLVLPPETPPGEYLLEVGMYRWDTGERLPVSGDGADPPARRILLGTVEVKP